MLDLIYELLTFTIQPDRSFWRPSLKLFDIGTGNKSLSANKKLVYHNCAVAADIAVAYCKSR